MKLRPARDTWFDAAPRVVIGDALGQFLCKIPGRSGADPINAISPDSIQYLGQLVYARFADEIAYPGDATVVSCSPAGLAIALGIHRHTAEFQHLELPAVRQPVPGGKHRCAKAILPPDRQGVSNMKGQENMSSRKLAAISDQRFASMEADCA